MNIWKLAGYFGKKLLLFFASILLLSAAVFLFPGLPRATRLCLIMGYAWKK